MGLCGLAKTTDIEHVAYGNPKNGKHSEYDLEVDRGADGKIERLNFKTVFTGPESSEDSPAKP